MNWIGSGFLQDLILVSGILITLVQLHRNTIFVNGHTHFFDWVDGNGVLKSSLLQGTSDNDCDPYFKTGPCWDNNTFVCKGQTFSWCLSELEQNKSSTTIGTEVQKIEKLFVDGEALNSLVHDHIDLVTEDLKFLSVLIKNKFSMTDLLQLLNRTEKLNVLLVNVNVSNLEDKSNNFTAVNKTDNEATFNVENLFIVGSQAIIGKWMNVTQLKYINLKESYRYPGASFEFLPNTLTAIDLGNTNLAQSSIYECLKDYKIDMVGLAGSYLEQVPKKLFYFSNTLQYLTLAKNNLEFPDGYLFDPSYPDLPELLELDLRQCNISWVTEYMFVKLPNLKKVSLSKNNIYYSGTLIQSSIHLKYLDFSFNQFSPFKNVATAEKFDMNYERSEISEKSFIDLSYTSFFCYQNINNLLTNVTHLSVVGSKACYNSIEFNLLERLEVLDMSCIFDKNTPLIPENVKQIFEQLSTIKEFFFRNNGFKFDGANEFVDALSRLISVEALHLDGNAIKFIPPTSFAQLENLESLNLSNNTIIAWHNSQLFYNNSRLKTLDISQNQIVAITDSMTKDFMNLTEVNLFNNPLICNEHLKYLICHSIARNNFTIRNYERSTCYNQPTGSYLHFNKLGEDDNCEKSNLIGIGDVTIKTNRRIPYHFLIPLLMVISACSVIIAKKWWTISYYVKIFRLTKVTSLLKKPTKKIGSNFQYDVFVSYSENDRSWLLDNLIPYLEAKSGMHICLHERDFKVGLGIMENIMECMYNSHCLLLVISKAFVKSKWCQFEMHLSQYILVETEKPHLILVFLEHIPKMTRPKILHYLMKTRTYIEWPTDTNHNGYTEEKNIFFKRLSYAFQELKSI